MNQSHLKHIKKIRMLKDKGGINVVLAKMKVIAKCEVRGAGN